MWRMILVTFAFLGYAFYEISGGPITALKAGAA